MKYHKRQAGFTPTPNSKSYGGSSQSERGFTLVEIVVATTIFAIVATAMMALFNYTLKINRRAEALRQATQGIRNFTEYIVKIVRNGQIDYGIEKDLSGLNSAVGPCTPPSALGQTTYSSKENRLGLYSEDGSERLCLYLGNAAGTYVGSGIYNGKTLVLQKDASFNQILNPPYFEIENLMFLIRPREDPYYDPPAPPPGCPGSCTPEGRQPFVSIIMKAIAKLPTGEVQPIYYQTTISSDKYDIPNE